MSTLSISKSQVAEFLRPLLTRRGMLALALSVVMTTLLIACGPPSKQTIQKLHDGAAVIVNVLVANATLPDQLLAEKIIKPEQYETVKKYMSEAQSGAEKVRDGLAVALNAEKPSLKSLAPIVADIIAQLRGLDSLVKHEMVQRVFGAAEIGLRILGSYFALQISAIRDRLRNLRDAEVAFTAERIFVDGHGSFSTENAGRLHDLLKSHEPTDRDVCSAAGFAYDQARFNLLANAYDGSRFEEYAAAL